jgi:2-octaprenyl-6-methoxyphenol hydroxylase
LAELAVKARSGGRAAGKRGAAECKLIVAGGGYVGLCVAVAIKASSSDISVTVIDAAPEHAVESDSRASAIAAAAVRMLDRLEIWPLVSEQAQPITEMVVTDSRLNDVVRPVFLTFGSEGPGQSAPFAYMLPNRNLVKALRDKARELGVTLEHGSSVKEFKVRPGLIELDLANGTSRSANLLIAADGVRSRLRDIAGIRTVHWPYDQMGIVATVEHERDHQGRAEEHFLPAGPFAILPLQGKRSSLVWTERTEDARRLIQSEPLVFELELERRFGHRLGQLSIEGKPKAYPLGLTLARDYVAERFALVGDAAHGIHPIAGQGLNLGFKDAAALAQTIVEAHRLGLDVGELDVLERYQQWRRFDTVQMGVMTDVLNRLFSNDSSFLRLVRDTGLGMVDRMPRLKTFFIDAAAGRDRSAPRLLQGEAI